MRILMIRRAEQFSPHSVENDRAILEAVAARLSQRGHAVTQVDEASLASCLATDTPDFIYSRTLFMGNKRPIQI